MMTICNIGSTYNDTCLTLHALRRNARLYEVLENVEGLVVICRMTVIETE